MKNLVQAFYTWYRKTLRHGTYRWFIIAGTLIYLLSPIDISPDVFPVVGWIDDGILVTLLVTELSQMAFGYLGERTRRKPAQTVSSDLQEPTIDVDAR